MADDINSIIREINEELKNDRLMEFFKKYKDAILVTVAVAVIGILAYSSWYNRRNQQKEEITNAILEDIQTPTKSSSLLIDALAENAPVELKPFC